MSADDYRRHSDALSPYSRLSTNKGDDDSILGLVIPSSNTGGGGEVGGFILPTDNPSSIRRSAEVGGFLGAEKEDFDPNPGFTIDEEGNLVLTKDHQTPHRQSRIGAPVRIMGSGTAASTHARRERQEGLEAGHIQVSIELNPTISQFC